MTFKPKDFDAAEYLDNEEVIAAYLQDALEAEDFRLLLLVVEDVISAIDRRRSEFCNEPVTE